MKYRKLPVSTQAVLLDHRRPICVVPFTQPLCNSNPPPTHPHPRPPAFLTFHEPGFVELMVFKSDCLKQHGNVSQRLAACGPRSLAVFVQRCRGCLHTACRTRRPSNRRLAWRHARPGQCVQWFHFLSVRRTARAARIIIPIVFIITCV